MSGQRFTSDADLDAARDLQIDGASDRLSDDLSAAIFALFDGDDVGANAADDVLARPDVQAWIHDQAVTQVDRTFRGGDL